MLQGRPAENERVNHTAHLEKHVPGRESKPQNTGQVQDFKTWSGWCRLGDGTAQRPGLWLSGQEASGQVGRLGRQPRAGQQLQSFSFQLRSFAVFLQPAFPTQPVHPGGKSLSPRPGLEGECSINDNCAHFFLFVFFFFQFWFFYWHIVDIQRCITSAVQQSDSTIHIYAFFFIYSFPFSKSQEC